MIDNNLKINYEDLYVFKPNEQSSSTTIEEYYRDIIILADIFKRFIAKKYNYIDTRFGTDEDLCLDGNVEISDLERAVIERYAIKCEETESWV